MKNTLIRILAIFFTLFTLTSCEDNLNEDCEMFDELVGVLHEFEQYKLELDRLVDMGIISPGEYDEELHYLYDYYDYECLLEDIAYYEQRCYEIQ